MVCYNGNAQFLLLPCFLCIPWFTLSMCRHFSTVVLWCFAVVLVAADDVNGQYRLASFRVDVTIPIGHRCMGVLPTKSKKIVDRLYANGFVLLGDDKPIVLCAVGLVRNP